MSAAPTAKALAAITDEGLFEQLATAILREAEPIYASLVHPGVNASGKTVKSPLDGICFVQGATPPHMIAVHHTITARSDLAKKWLHDPSTVKPRKRSGPAAPAGDLIKTAEIVAEERKRTPNLRATLVLTTNEEPDQALVRSVEAEGRARGMEIDLWSRSRLSHILDSRPTGQWIRRSFLNIEQEQLSAELLHVLSEKSLRVHRPLDNPDTWIPRALDAALAKTLRRDVTFLVAASGMGKSVACFRSLKTHVESGGFGIILPHEAVAASITLQQAVAVALRALHPLLAETAVSSLDLCAPDRPLLLVVEDVNRSGQAQKLTEKLAGWSSSTVRDEACTPSRWRLLCPLWPEILASLGDQPRRLIEQLTVTTDGFSRDEGRNAVMLRAQVNGHPVTPLTAQEIAGSLGDDPLLLALHDLSAPADPHKTIQGFVEGCISRAAAEVSDHVSADYRKALRALAGKMLADRQMDVTWQQVSACPLLQGEPLHLLSRLAHQGELIRLIGPPDDERLSFRHDRVREWVLADAAADLDRRGLLGEDTVSEPYFAEVLGAALVWGKPQPDFLQRIASLNPLALFHALHLIGSADTPARADMYRIIDAWLDTPAAHDRSHLHLRWEAMAKLAETDSSVVPTLASKFQDCTTSVDLAQLRNGDLGGAIELCVYIGPGTGAPWRDLQIEHAQLRYGRQLVAALDAFLRRRDLNSAARIGAIRMAGHMAEASLAPAIEACWVADGRRCNYLVDYIWAFAECCGDDPLRYLGPVCDAWAALPDQSEKDGWPSPRDGLASHELRWAFQKWPPVAALEYFVQRGSQDDLRWPITYMLHGVDHPKAVSFVAHELAAIKRRLEGTGSFSTFAMSARDEWRRAQDEHGRPMSKASRDLLLGLWRHASNDKHLRSAAFSLWAATRTPEDIEVLRTESTSDILADSILSERLIRGDQEAIPAMVKKVASEEGGYWWQSGRYIWSADLTTALDEFLGRRGARASRTWFEPVESDWITSEMIVRLPGNEAEKLLMKHWDHLRFVPDFVQSALYAGTPRLDAAAKAAIAECPAPGRMVEHLHRVFGVMTKGHPGIVRESQVQALAPYLSLLSPLDIGMLWDECNRHGWFQLRRDLLDQHLGMSPRRHLWGRESALSELDRMVTEKHLSMLRHWVEGFLQADVAWKEILSTMTTWLQERRSIEALQVVASAVETFGTRDDLGVLTVYDGMPDAAHLIIADTEYTVRRRSIR